MNPLDSIVNFGRVTVSTGYNNTATSIALTSGKGAILPASGNYNLVWWNSTAYSDPSFDPNVEIVRVTAGQGTDTLTVTRAQEGTSASNKNTGGATYTMTLSFTAKMLSDIELLSTQAHGFTISGTIATGKTSGFYTHPHIATLVGWNFAVDAGTATVTIWKIAAGTAVPTVANSISTSGVSISTGTAVQSTTMTDFTTTAVTANDIFAYNISAVSGVGQMTFELIFKNT
jgi:hypothetical protein